MATSRSSAAALLAAVLFAGLAGAGCARTEGAAPPAQAGPARIDPVRPERDFVGPAPAAFEWTAVPGAEHYEMELLTDVDQAVFNHGSIDGTVLPLPEGLVLTPGTYFWRVGAVRAGRLIGDSGRSAFVVRDP